MGVMDSLDAIEDERDSAYQEGYSAGIVSMCCRGLKNKHHNMLWKYAS